MSSINFTDAAKSVMAQVFAELGLTEAPEFCENHNWFQRLAYQTPTMLLFIDCESDRGYGVDIQFRRLEPQSDAGRDYSLHTFLRIYDPQAALQVGYGLPNDQRDLDDLLRLFGAALLKHRHALFDETDKTIASMERVFQESDFANQTFAPVGRFRG